MGNILVPFKKFLSNKNTITILGVLLGVVVLYLGYNWRVNRSIQPTRIPYANKTMVAGTKVTENDEKKDENVNNNVVENKVENKVENTNVIDTTTTPLRERSSPSWLGSAVEPNEKPPP